MVAPLFLLAPPRSYTSLINAMLGQHPQAFGLPELCLFNVETLGQLWVRNSDEMGSEAKTRHGLLRAVAEIYAGEQTLHSVRMAEHWCAARQQRSVASVYQELVDKVDPLMIVEKSPAYTVEPRRLRADFLHRAVESLQLNASVFLGRAERAQGTYDVITARAVADLSKLLKISAHLSTRKSRWLLPKGRSAERELAEAQQAWQGVFHVERSTTDPESRIVVCTGVRAKR